MARLTSFTVNGVEVAADRLRDLTLNLDQQMNGRSVLDCVLVDPASSYRPDLRQEVVMELDGVRQFGGVVWDQTEHDIGPPLSGAQNTVAVTDFSALIDKVLFNGPIAAGTLASQLVPLVANLGPQGITLSPSQDDGPAMVTQAFEFLTIRECLDALSIQSRWIWSIDAFKVLRMFDPGTIAAPFQILEDEGNYVSIEWNRNLNEYANEMWGRYGPHGVLLYTESHTGDGTSRTFRLQQELVLAGLSVTPAGYVTVTRAGPTVSLETIDADPILGTAQWHYDIAATWNNQIIQALGTTLAVGETVSITYNAQFPGAAFVRDGDEYAEFGPFTDLIDFPDIIDPVIAQSTLEGELRRRIGVTKRVMLVTDDPGLEPRQTLTFDVPSREVVGDYLIVSVRTREVSTQTSDLEESGDRYFRYEVECVEGNEWRENWEPFWLPEPAGRTGGTPILGPRRHYLEMSVGYYFRGSSYQQLYSPNPLGVGELGLGILRSGAGVSSTNIMASLHMGPSVDMGAGPVPTDPNLFRVHLTLNNNTLVLNQLVDVPWADPAVGLSPQFDRRGWDWHAISFHLRTSTYNGTGDIRAAASYAADGHVQLQADGVAIIDVTGLTLPLQLDPTLGESVLPAWMTMGGDMDDLWCATDFAGTQRVVTSDLENVGPGRTGAGYNPVGQMFGTLTGIFGTPGYMQSDGGHSGSVYSSWLSTSNGPNSGPAKGTSGFFAGPLPLSSVLRYL